MTHAMEVVERPSTVTERQSLEWDSACRMRPVTTNRRLDHTDSPRTSARMYGLVLLLAVACCSVSCVSSTVSPPSDVGTSSPTGGDVEHESSTSTPSGPILDLTTPLTRFMFGSCNQLEKDQPLWAIMQEREPQLFIWLGDVVYADRAKNVAAMKSMYRGQYAKAEYAEFREWTQIIGIYDDHDYGVNDGDATYVDKEATRQLFLDFIDESPTSARRYRDGVYESYVWGPPGQRVKIILLDARYNQDPVRDDMLGESQWTWLESVINADDDVQLYVLGTGVQLVSTDKRIGEGWRLKPKSRARVFDLFARRQRNRDASIVFLSGDVHFAEADATYVCTQEEVRPDSDEAVVAQVTVTPFYEFTSSGLTHSVATQATQTLTELAMPYILGERTSFAEMEGDSTAALHGYFAGLNFGQVDINWHQRRVDVRMVDKTGAARLHYSLPFASLASTTYRTDMSVPLFLSSRCDSERMREQSPAMWVIRGMHFVILIIISSQFALAVVVAYIWHRHATRSEWRAKQGAARASFKQTLKEKQANKEKAKDKKKKA